MEAMVIPRIDVLSTEQIAFIHDRSLDILGRAGVRVDSPRARQILAASGGIKFISEDRLVLEPGLVEWAIRTAPQIVDIYDRRGNLAFQLGKSSSGKNTSARFGVGVTNLYYQDPLTDEVTPFSRQHMALAVRLGEHLPNFDLISTVGVVQDYPPETADLYAVLEMVANTTKPLVILISNEMIYTRVLNLLERLHGDLAARPFIVPYFNPVTPLVINQATADKMLDSIDRGLPVIFSNYSMAGMSTPITASGTLTLMNAELLAGLVLAQLARPGAPVILGSLPAFFDMRTMQDFYDPHTLLINLACAEMMAHYGIPHAGTSGSGIGWGPDLPAAGLQWMNHLTSLLGKAGLAPFVGGNLGSKAFSPALVVYADEIIAQARRFAQGFPLDDEMLGLEEIVRRGPAGNFLDADLTMQLYRRAYHQSKLSPHLSLEKWQERGRPQWLDLLRQQTAQLLEQSRAPEDHDEVIARGEAFISGR
jgi:trimethylamine---corrinoid protein Co-methyltransferase